MNVSLRIVGKTILGGFLGLVLSTQQVQAQSTTRVETVKTSPTTNTRAKSVVQTRNERVQATSERYRKSQQRAYRPSAFGFNGKPASAMGFTPKHQKTVGTSVVQEAQFQVVDNGNAVQQIGGQVITDIAVEGNVVAGNAGCSSCGNNSCGGSCGGSCGSRGCLIPCPWLNVDNIEVFGGVNGFKSPANRGQDGSFGFYEGINYTSGLPCGNSDISMQIGFMGTQTNFGGSNFTGDERQQFFFTTGLYRRVDYGLQWGVVFDYLHDEWDVSFDVSQIRGEFSWVYPAGAEIGFWFNASARDVNVTLPSVGAVTLETTDVYAFFYRHQFDQRFGGGEGRLFAGFTGNSDGIIGGDVLLPISENVSIRSEFTYLIPEENTTPNGGVGSATFGETWNISVGLVWYPGCSNCDRGYNRALLNVANNGSLLINNR